MRDLIRRAGKAAGKAAGTAAGRSAGTAVAGRGPVGWLARRLRGRGEQGAIGVLVVVLISGGVLVGMGALVIDVGQLYQERAELQDGADAGALAVAKSCALANCNPGVANQYADANASALTGGVEGVGLVCGSGGGLGGCPGSSGNLIDCPPAPPAGNTYVDVHTSTETASGSTLLPPAFARTLLGKSNYNGSTVDACAQAEWGAPASATVAGVTISACEWDQATNRGANFAPAPPYPPDPFPAPSFDRVIELHGTGRVGGCPTEPGGADAPGNFGWIADPDGTCTLAIAGGTYGGNTGANVSHDCQNLLANSRANRSVIFVPVYVSVRGNGNGVTYTLKGFAAFVVTGYRMPGFRANDWLDGNNNCGPGAFCLNGYFTTALLPSGTGTGGADLGADVIKITG